MPKLGVKLREKFKETGNIKLVQKAFSEGLREKKIAKSDFSIRELADAFMGERASTMLQRYSDDVRFRESEAAVDASNFSAITGQLLVDTVKEKYELATLVGNEIFTDVPVSNGNLGTQIEPGLGRVKNLASPVNQQQNYPHTTFDSHSVTYPAPVKRGLICNVTMEAIFSDLTTQIIESAESVGDMTGVTVEFDKMSVFLGVSNSFVYNGTGLTTYNSASWGNSLLNFTFTDYRSMNTIEQLFSKMRDPFTGLPIRVDVKDVFVMPAMRYAVNRILTASIVNIGNITLGEGIQTSGPNLLTGNQRVITSALARHLLTVGVEGFALPGTFTDAVADTVQVFGDFKKAFVNRVVYPLRVTQAPPLNPLDFGQDIVLSVKASVYSKAAVRDPKYVTRTYNAAAV